MELSLDDMMKQCEVRNCIKKYYAKDFCRPHYVKFSKSWRAQLMVKRKLVLSKYFKTEQEAIKARKDAESFYNIVYPINK